jgi:L-ascorbate metabolism protein UlaG (beta-lactamase superfamily)
MFCKSWYCRLRFIKPAHHEWAVDHTNVPINRPTIIWIGHSTFLIQLDGITILTDPIFGDASPLFKRIFPPSIALNQLMPIDYILISHNHRDHMDAESLLQLRHHNSHILVPHGDKRWFVRRGFRLVEEKIWWESSTFKRSDGDLKFTFLPAHHWSQRSLFDRNKSLWGSWMIEYKGSTIYFAGDTAYAAHFSKIRTQFPSIDIALMPIGPCEPHTAMKAAHINAEQAGEAFIELGAKIFIPMHWGTFYFGMDSFSYPVEQLRLWWNNQNSVTKDQLAILKLGQQWSLIKDSNDALQMEKTYSQLQDPMQP